MNRDSSLVDLAPDFPWYRVEHEDENRCWDLLVGGPVAALLLSGVVARPDVLTKPLQTFGYGDIVAMTVSSDGKHLVTGGSVGVLLSDIQSAKVIRRFDADGRPISCVALSADGQCLVAGCRNGYGWQSTAILWDAESGERLHSLVLTNTPTRTF